MFSREHLETAVFRAGYLAIWVVLVLPLLVVISTSFTKSGYITFPPEEVTLSWYGEFLADTRWKSAVESSIIIATGTTFLSTTLGVATAFGFRNVGGRTIRAILPLILLPLLVPAVVIAIALLPFLSELGLYQTHIGVILAHSLWATPLTFFVMQSVLDRFDWELRDAAIDLGAGPGRTFLEIIFPSIKNGIFAAGLIAFIVSLQEFIMALFLTGQDTQTIPVLAWTSLRQVLDPVVSVVAALLIASVTVITLLLMGLIGLDRVAKNL